MIYMLVATFACSLPLGYTVMAVNNQCAVTQAYAPRRSFVFSFPFPAAGSARHTDKRI
jgi:hypothetical protein